MDKNPVAPRFRLIDPSRLDPVRSYEPLVLAAIGVTDDGVAVLVDLADDPAIGGLLGAFAHGIRHEGEPLFAKDGAAFIEALRGVYGNPCGPVLVDIEACAALDAALERSPAPPAAFPAIAS